MVHFQNLLDGKETPLGVDNGMEIARQTAAALVFLHSKKMAHRDIKPENILLYKWGPNSKSQQNIDVKLIDFGLSKSTESEAFTGQIGTPSFMAPELIKRTTSGDSSYDAAKVDVWAFGVLLHYLYTGAAPYDSMRGAEIIAEILQGSTLAIEDDFPDGLKSLLADCWHLTPQDRPTMAAVEKRLQSSSKGWKGRPSV